ncbi:RNA methyltransferase [Carboxylicivirga sp. N1Y90]|uniref:RNA methyltransferase n=1 Tax=Carboxylicivirga fragile TaxID=3417571 RepID=UPI003D32B318|nr:RNA methyltransferase [Marinilabiliaceae bacterium N1Y90]
MLSKNKQKHITALGRKKIRDQEKLFVAEGQKLVLDLLQSDLNCQYLIVDEKWISTQSSLNTDVEIIKTSSDSIKKVSGFKSTPSIIGVFEQNSHRLEMNTLKNQLCLFLDDIQDPGNLGTIIRLADWFGIKSVICSKACADVYNPKTIQSTMGAIARIQTHYVETLPFFEEYKSLNCPVYGTFLDGKNLYQEELNNNGLIIMGNEGKGIQDKLEPYVSSRLFIPNYPPEVATSESLNVSVATAIICAEFRRRLG